MKKILEIFVAVALCTALFVACNSSPSTITVTLNANYTGGATNTETTDTATVYSPSWTPSRSGYRFTNWYYDANCSNKYTATTLKSNTTLYAGWEKEPDIVNVKCKVDLSQLTLTETDFVNAVASYKEGSYSGHDDKTKVVSDSSVKSMDFTFGVRAVAGSIAVEVVHDGKTIGKGSTSVSKYTEGVTYNVTVIPAN